MQTINETEVSTLDTLTDDILFIIFEILCSSVIASLEWYGDASSWNDTAKRARDRFSLQMVYRRFRGLFQRETYVSGACSNREQVATARCWACQISRASFIISQTHFSLSEGSSILVEQYFGTFRVFVPVWQTALQRTQFVRQLRFRLGVRAKLFYLAPTIWSQDIRCTTSKHSDVNNLVLERYKKKIVMIEDKIFVHNLSDGSSWDGDPLEDDSTPVDFYAWWGISVKSCTIFYIRESKKPPDIEESEIGNGGNDALECKYGRFGCGMETGFFSP